MLLFPSTTRYPIPNLPNPMNTPQSIRMLAALMVALFLPAPAAHATIVSADSTDTLVETRWVQADSSNVLIDTTSPYLNGKAANFSSAQLADPLVSGLAADPDHDGLLNLLEFAFNLPPLASDFHKLTPGSGMDGLPRITVVQVGGQPRLRFESVRRHHGGITYLPQASDAMTASGSDSCELLTGIPVITPINADWDRVVVEDVAGTGSRNRLGRVKVTLP